MIKNIIFDFGGVIYDIDHSLSKKAFLKLGVENFDELYGHQKQTHLFEKIERGEINVEDFYLALRNYLPHHISDKQIEDAWCALMVGFEKAKVDLLEQLRKNYRIFLLSNSNIIHYRRFIIELDAYKPFRDLFTDVWFSHEKHQRKPEAAFYNDMLIKHQMKPRETLFIDDLDVNIEAAQKLGLQTYYLQNKNSILDLFKDGVWIGK